MLNLLTRLQLRNLYFTLISMFLLGCVEKNKWKQLDLEYFQIEIPVDWTYVEDQGMDSFIGEFTNGDTNLSFDYCDFGCAYKLIPTIEEYLEDYSYKWIPSCPFCEFENRNTHYTSLKNVENLRKQLEEKSRNTESDSLIVKPYPNYFETYRKSNNMDKVEYPNSDYICTLRHKMDSIEIPIEIPAEVKEHTIEIKRNNKFIIKRITPNSIGKGMTGIYYKSVDGNLNFNLFGYDIPSEDNSIVLEIFDRLELK